MAKVSIIVPVYNVEQYLEKCLDSLINQTLKDIEIVVVNDGSSDDSQTIIDKYELLDNRIVALKKKNGGLSDARNYGFKHAKADYLGFVDSDDWIEPDMFEKLYNNAIKEDSDLVVCNLFYAYEDGKCEPANAYSLTDDSVETYILGNPSAWNKLYHRSLLNENYWPKGLYYEDFASNPLLALKAKKITFISENLYYYLIRDNSIMRKKTFSEKNGDILVGANLLLSTIKSEDKYKTYMNAYEFVISEHLLHGTYFNIRKLKDKRIYRLLTEISLFMKTHFPDFQKNKYYLQQGLKYRIVTSLIYKRHYFILKLLLRK